MKYLFYLLLIIIAFQNCRSTKQAKPIAPTPPPQVAAPKIQGEELNGTWVLQRLWGAQNKWDSIPAIVINFADKTFSGFTGCNSITGKFTIQGNFININKDMTAEKNGCKGNTEKTYLSLLLKINRYAADDSVLELSQDDIVLMKFLKK